MITITPSAAKRINTARAKAGCTGLAARLTVRGECCSDREYLLVFSEKKEGDLEFRGHGASLLVDPATLAKANGLEIGFIDGVPEGFFTFKKAHSESGCGDSCGHHHAH